MIRLSTIKLDEFQTLEVMALATRAPETYMRLLGIAGNSILSSIFVESMDAGAVLNVRYWDTTTGSEATEEYTIGNHLEITPSMLGPQGLTLRESFTKIHDKAFLEATVSGGNVRFGIYGTIVSSFATDLDAALQYEGSPVQLDRNKGIPITVYDTGSDEWEFLRSTNGRLQVDVPSGLQVTQIVPNMRFYLRTPSASPSIINTHVDYTVPVGKEFYWICGNGTSASWCRWDVTIDGSKYLSKRNAFDTPNVDLSIGSSLQLSAGQRIIVTAVNLNPYGHDSDIETFLFGREIAI
jgi:hypothetical protein